MVSPKAVLSNPLQRIRCNMGPFWYNWAKLVHSLILRSKETLAVEFEIIICTTYGLGRVKPDSDSYQRTMKTMNSSSDFIFKSAKSVKVGICLA